MDSTIIVALIGAGVTLGNVVLTHLISRKAKLSERDQHLANGVQCLLRAEIIRAHDKYTQKHFCPIYAKESLTRAYAAYHALGGNDVATDLYRQCMELPESEENYEN